MRVAAEHTELLVTADRRDFDDVQTEFEQTADALVPEIMEAQSFDTGSDQETSPGLLQRSRRHREDARLVRIGVRLPARQRVEGALRQRHLTTITVFGDIERGDPAIVREIAPGESQNLATTHA